MSVSFWESTPTVYEARVSPGDVNELARIVDRMIRECIAYHGTTEQIMWRIDGEVLVLSFPGGSQSVGWSGPGQ